jgi:DNA-binding protein HU-beta
MIEIVAKQSEIPKSAATRAVNAMIFGVTSTLKKGGSVSLPGLGTLSVSKSAKPTSRKPRTGSKKKAAKVAEFRPSKALKDAL